MNIIVLNRRNVEFELADLDVKIMDNVMVNAKAYYLIEVRMLSQIWILRKRYSDFDRMHSRLKNDLELKASDNLPKLPIKKIFFNNNPQFIQERMQELSKYLKFLILIYEAIENPILQRFLEIDTRFMPNHEYTPIDLYEPDRSSFFLETNRM